MSRQISAKIPQLEKRLNKQRRYNQYDENTRTPIVNPLEEKETYQMFFNAMKRVMPDTGGMNAIVEKATLVDATIHPETLLSADARCKYEGMLRMPANYQTLPEGQQQMNSIAEATLGNNFQMKPHESNADINFDITGDDEDARNQYHHRTMKVPTYYLVGTGGEVTVRSTMEQTQETRVAIEDLQLIRQD